MSKKSEQEKTQAAQAKAEKEAKAAAEKKTRPKAGKKGNTPAFQINIGDPFIDGTIRAYQSAGGKGNVNARPFVLLATDPAAAIALINYQQRCNGACDNNRSEEVAKAIAAFKEFV